MEICLKKLLLLSYYGTKWIRTSQGCHTFRMFGCIFKPKKNLSLFDFFLIETEIKDILMIGKTYQHNFYFILNNT